MSADAGWRIAKSGAIAPPPGSTHAAAYLLRLMRGSSRREVIVEFADSMAVLSTSYAEEVTRPFLDDLEPPQHLVVEPAGTVRIELGPHDTFDDDRGDSSQSASTQAPQRARSHRRGTYTG
jgi:hypothetical protein